jgi:SAM-dependent methyltransferase
MIQNNIKTAYQNSQITYGNNTAERLVLGQREIQTLKLLAAEIGYEPSPQNMLLDLGCADRFLELACKSENWIYRGLDYTDVNFEIGTFPVDNNSVDFAVSLAVIEHLRDPENFISEVYRCLKPGGVVYLSTPNFQLDWKNFYNDPTHVRPYTPESLEQLLKLSGFTSVASFPGLRCKDISWYRGKNRFLKAYYLLPFRSDTIWPAPKFLRGHARSIFALARKPLL